MSHTQESFEAYEHAFRSVFTVRSPSTIASMVGSLGLDGACSLFSDVISPAHFAMMVALATHIETIPGESSPALARIDYNLGKPQGYACRALLKGVASASAVDSQLLADYAARLVRDYLEVNGQNILVKGGLHALVQAISADPDHSLPTKILERICSPQSAADFERTAMILIESATKKSFEDAQGIYVLLKDLSVEKSVPAAGLFSVLHEVMSSDKLSEDQTFHLIDLLISDTASAVWLQGEIQTALDGSGDKHSPLMMAVDLGIKHLGNDDAALGDTLNSLDTSRLTSGVKTKSDIDTITSIVGFDVSKLDRKSLTHEASGGLFTMELGV